MHFSLGIAHILQSSQAVRSAELARSALLEAEEAQQQARLVSEEQLSSLQRQLRQLQSQVMCNTLKCYVCRGSASVKPRYIDTVCSYVYARVCESVN